MDCGNAAAKRCDSLSESLLPMRWSVLLLVVICPSMLSAENWPGWRGPRGDGTSIESNVPITWDVKTSNNIAWKTPLTYSGHSSAIVWDDHLFLTGADEANPRRMLLALDRK